jgi:hypothetical protein
MGFRLFEGPTETLEKIRDERKHDSRYRVSKQ